MTSSRTPKADLLRFRGIGIIPDVRLCPFSPYGFKLDEKDAPSAPSKAEKQLSEFVSAFSKKYGFVLEEPIPERLADLIQRLKEIKLK